MKISIDYPDILNSFELEKKLQNVHIGTLLNLINPDDICEIVPDLIEIMTTALAVDEMTSTLQQVGVIGKETVTEIHEDYKGYDVYEKPTGSPYHTAIANVCTAILALYTVTKESPVL